MSQNSSDITSALKLVCSFASLPHFMPFHYSHQNHFDLSANICCPSMLINSEPDLGYSFHIFSFFHILTVFALTFLSTSRFVPWPYSPSGMLRLPNHRRPLCRVCPSLTRPTRLSEHEEAAKQNRQLTITYFRKHFPFRLRRKQ